MHKARGKLNSRLESTRGRERERERERDVAKDEQQFPKPLYHRCEETLHAYEMSGARNKHVHGGLEVPQCCGPKGPKKVSNMY